MKFVKYRVLEKDVDGIKFFYPQKLVFPLPIWLHYKVSYTGHDISNMGLDSLKEAIDFLELRQKKPTIKKKIHNLS